MKITIDYDSENPHDQKLARSLAEGVLEILKVDGVLEHVRKVAEEGFGKTEGFPNPAERRKHTEVFENGRDQLHALVDGFRDIVASQEEGADAADFGDILVPALRNHGPDIVAYVESFPDFVEAIRPLWPPRQVQTMDAMEATIRRAAAQMLTIAGAHGFAVPAKWHGGSHAAN